MYDFFKGGGGWFNGYLDNLAYLDVEKGEGGGYGC